MPITTTQTASQFRSEDYLIVIKGLMYDVMQDNSKVDQVSQRVAMVRFYAESIDRPDLIEWLDNHEPELYYDIGILSQFPEVLEPIDPTRIDTELWELNEDLFEKPHMSVVLYDSE